MRVLVLTAALLLGFGCDRGIELMPPDGDSSLSLSELRDAPDEFENTTVQIPQALVLADDRFDESGTGRTGTVHVVDVDNPAGGGLQLFAPSVLTRDNAALSPGDIVSLRGQFVVFRGPRCPESRQCGALPGCFCFQDRTLPQFSLGASVERIGFWKDPDPIVLTASEFMSNPSAHVGNLVRIENLTVSVPYEDLGSRIGNLETEEGVEISADLFVIEGAEVGTRIQSVTGVAGYFFSDFVMPRSPNDVELSL